MVVLYNLLFNSTSSLFIDEVERKKQLEKDNKKEYKNLFINENYFSSIQNDTIGMLCLEIGLIGLFKGFDVINTYKAVKSSGDDELKLLMYMFNLSKEYSIRKEKEYKELERKNRR